MIFGKISKIIKETTLKVYSGNDNLTLPILSIGGSGVISVIANVYPKLMSELCSSYETDKEHSKFIHYKLLDLMDAMFIDVNPICVKYAMNVFGLEVGKTRLPLCDTDENKMQIIKNAIENF